MSVVVACALPPACLLHDLGNPVQVAGRNLANR